ncbi:MAG: imidazole glycerol phosphate synthase subunit HisH, partial [Ferruginibacter sp.]
MSIVIIKYNAGNIQSVQYALKRLNTEAIVTDDIELIKNAGKVIFPGVGHAGAAMDSLKEKNLDTVIRNLRQPVLGVCVGLQLLCRHSEEGNTDCIGIFDTKVKRFRPVKEKVPQVGWNNISGLRSDLFSGLPEDQYVYFVHSYYAELCADTIATGNYINEYSAALLKDNFYAVQFHTEKS